MCAGQGSAGQAQGLNTPSWVPQNSQYVGRLQQGMQQFNQQPAFGGQASNPYSPGGNPSYGLPTTPPPQVPTQPQFGRQPVNMAPPPTMQAPTAGGPTPEQLAAHMAQRNNITNGYVDPGQKPTPQQLAAHMAANAAYTNGYGTQNPVPLPPWLLPR